MHTCHRHGRCVAASQAHPSSTWSVRTCVTSTPVIDMVYAYLHHKRSSQSLSINPAIFLQEMPVHTSVICTAELLQLTRDTQCAILSHYTSPSELLHCQPYKIYWITYHAFSIVKGMVAASTPYTQERMTRLS